MNKLFISIGVIAGLIIGFVGGGYVAKISRPKIPPCPACPSLTCPPSTKVSLQDFNADNLRKVKGNITYQPTLTNVTIEVTCSDSVLLRELLRSQAAVERRP